MTLLLIDESAAPGCRSTARARLFTRSWRALLLGSVASAALIGAARAADFTWIGATGDHDLWNTAEHWQLGGGTAAVPPEAGDTAYVATGDVAVDFDASVGTLDISGGVVRVGHGVVLNVDTLTISDNAELRVSSGTDPVTNPQGEIFVSGSVTVDGGLITNSGLFTVTEGGSFVQSGGTVEQISLATPTYEQTGGEMNAVVTTTTYTHSGGSMDNTITAEIYRLTSDQASGNGWITASDSFELAAEEGDFAVDSTLLGTGNLVKSGNSTITLTNPDSEYTGSTSVEAGTLIAWGDALPELTDVSIGDDATLIIYIDDQQTLGDVTTGTGSFVKWGGGLLTLGGKVDLDVITVDGGTVQLGTGTSTGPVAFNEARIALDATLALAMAPAGAPATVSAYLTGEGNLAKAGLGTVTLTNQANDFTGTVTIEAGTLDVVDRALPDSTAISIADDATLQLTINTDKTLLNPLSGDGGSLVKAGSATLVLGSDITLGDLLVKGGTVQVGTGVSETFVSFDAATIDEGATLYVAPNATLTIRIPNNLTNNGTFINEGTVYDDLDNTGPVNNTGLYEANVLSNISTINNDFGGEWIGNIVSNGPVVFPIVSIISNNAGASWDGDVLSNSAIIDNHGTWEGDVAANAGAVNNYNEWDGDILGNDSQIANSGTWTGAVTGNNNAIFNDPDSIWNGVVRIEHAPVNTSALILNRGTWKGEVEANASYIVNDRGATWTGAVTSSDQVRNADGAWNGAVTDNSGLIWNLGGVWTGAVTSNSGNILNQGGVWDQIETGGASWIGDVTENAGTITNALGSTWTGAVTGNAGGTIINQGVWTGDFTNGGLVKARNQIVGAFTNSGTLQVTGTLDGITNLTNTGTVSLAGGGVTQRLTVGTVSFAAEGFFDVDIDGGGNSDRLLATSATLDGTVRYTTTAGPHEFMPLHTILTADSFTGKFEGATTDLAFVTPDLTYDEHNVYLGVSRSNRSFADATDTANQAATAEAVEHLQTGNDIFDAVTWLTEDDVGAAFDALSGEGHRSAASAYLQGQSVVTDIVTDRINQAFDALGSGDGAVSGYAGVPDLGAPQPQSGLWGTLYGAQGGLAGDGNAAPTDWATGGVVGGLDGVLADWRLGLMLQAGLSGTSVAERDFSSTSADYGVGIYGGRQLGDTRIVAGATYGRHDISTARDVDLPGFTDHLSADYAAATASAFGTVSHEIDFGPAALTMFGSLAYVSHATDAFAESGGDAALTGDASVLAATFTTLGLTVDHKSVVGDEMLLTTSGSLGWRHAFTASAPSSTAFAGGPDFAVAGAALAADTLVLSAGLDLELNATNTLALDYDGQLGVGSESHAVKGSWAAQF